MNKYNELNTSMTIIGVATLASSAYCLKRHFFDKETEVEEEEKHDEMSTSLSRSIEDMVHEDPEQVITDDNIELRKRIEENKSESTAAEKRNPWDLHNTFLKDTLTDDAYRRLSTLQTEFQSTLDDCIRPGMDNPDGNPGDPEKSCGFVACDAYCYVTFRELFDEIIRLRHPKFAADPEIHFRLCDLTTFRLLKCPKFDFSQVTRVEVEVHRNLRNYKFPPGLNRKQRRRVMELLENVLTKCTKQTHNVPSIFYDMIHLTDTDIWELTELNLLPDIPDNLYEISAGLRREWPDGRGVWLCKDLNMAALLNVNDHIVLKSWSTDGSLSKLAKSVSVFYKNFSNMLKIDEHEVFAMDPCGDFGYLTTFPELLGSAMVFRADIHFDGFMPDEKTTADFTKQIAKNTGLIVRCLQVNEHNSCSTLTVETKASLGYHDYKLLQMFEGGIERLMKLREEKIAASVLE